eukprot:g3182.t1 g3182   contig12:1578680-1579405(+)
MYGCIDICQEWQSCKSCSSGLGETEREEVLLGSGRGWNWQWRWKDERLGVASKSFDATQTKGLYQMSAVLKTGGGKGRGTSGNTGSNKPAGGGSVTVSPVPPNLTSKDIGDVKHGRICHIEWKHLLALPSSRNSPSNRHLLSVTTDTGAKHQIRAMLALAGGAPISGDLRYGNNVSNINQSGGRVSQPLPDGSVALHARSVFLPTVSLGGMEFLKEEPFVAPIPTRWRDFFGICEEDVRHL